MRGRGPGSMGRKSRSAAPSGVAGRDGTGREGRTGGRAGGGGALPRRRLQALRPRLQASADNLLPAISRYSHSIYNPIALPLDTRLCFRKYTDTFKEFRRGRERRLKLKVKHNLKLYLHRSFYNQLVTCLALNTVYVHN